MLPQDAARTFYDALQRGDMTSAFALIDPEIRWITPAGLVWASGPYEGIAALKTYFGHVAASITDLSVQIDELLPCGDRIVAVGRESGTVKATGRSFSVPCVHLLSFSFGRLKELVGFIDTARIADAF